jgi:hypothetical protein
METHFLLLLFFAIFIKLINNSGFPCLTWYCGHKNPVIFGHGSFFLDGHDGHWDKF